MERNKTMKNKYTTIVALAAAALATSCASEDIAEPQEQNQGEPKTVTLTASVNEAQTRVGMTKENSTTAKFYWQKGDKISVLTTDGSNYYNAEFTTEDGTGAASATFTGEVTGKVGAYALYPYNANYKFNGTEAPTYNLPASYEYDKVESNIFKKTTEAETTYPSNSTNIPMLGTIANGKVSFKHLGGLAVIRIDNMPAESGTLTVTANEQLSGDFTVSGLTSTPNIATASTSTDADKQVTFNFSGASTTSAGVFYLPLATGNYTNLKIVIAYGDDNATTQTIPYGSLTVKRANVTAIPLSTDSKGNLRYIKDNGDGSYTINGHEFVDLGLDVLWAKTNIGADSETAYGNYYAWGEVTAYGEETDWGNKDKKTNYSWDNYKYGTENNFTKYTSSDKTTLESSDDAATVNWGSSCRMPTQAEFDKLNSCTGEWATVDGVKGRKVTGKEGYSNSIFLPISGLCSDGDVYGRQTWTYYWSSSLYTDDDRAAYGFYLYPPYMEGYGDDGSHKTTNQPRYHGLTVRPVAEL